MREKHEASFTRLRTRPLFPSRGRPLKGTWAHNPANHNAGEGDSSLSPVAPEELVREVCEIIGEDSLLSVGIEPFLPRFSDCVYGECWRRHIRRKLGLARASLLIAGDAFRNNFDLIEVLTGFELAQRVAVFDPFKGQVLVLDSVPLDHPFVRLELVGAIADALLIKGLLCPRVAIKIHLRVKTMTRLVQQRLSDSE